VIQKKNHTKMNAIIFVIALFAIAESSVIKNSKDTVNTVVTEQKPQPQVEIYEKGLPHTSLDSADSDSKVNLVSLSEFEFFGFSNCII
jgi:hypothetical protein